MKPSHTGCLDNFKRGIVIGRVQRCWFCINVQTGVKIIIFLYILAMLSILANLGVFYMGDIS